MKLKELIVKQPLTKILVAAFIFRIVISFLGQHEDLSGYFYWWARDIWQHGITGFYDRDIINAREPNYPAVSSYVFWLSVALYEVVWRTSWFLNLNIPLFPSGFIFWLESPQGWYLLLKLPAILADLGIAYIIYRFVSELKDKKAAILSAFAFSFSLPVWYNSALWGQTESIFSLFLLAALYLTYKNRLIWAALAFTLSVLSKPLALFASPIFAFWWFRKAGFKTLLKSLLLTLFLTFALYYPFHPSELLKWIFGFYTRTSGGALSYLTANAFNFWGLVFGFSPKLDSVLFLGIPAYQVGYTVFAGIALYLMWQVWIGRDDKKREVVKILLLACLVSFAAFLFLPRMHERYLYPALLLLAPLSGLNTHFWRAFWALSVLHFLNLYHFWWVPKVDFLVELFSNRLVEQILILLTIGVFVYLFAILRKDYAKA